MTFPHSPQPGPRPGPPGGVRPGPPPGGLRPGPSPTHRPAPSDDPPPYARTAVPTGDAEETGHPAVDAALRSIANAARLAPAEQIAAYEAAHQVFQETLASIDR